MRSNYAGEFDILLPAMEKSPATVLKQFGNQLTTYEVPYVHYGCGCGRQFVGEEHYICFKCSKTLCQYCISQDEIETFYCRNCLDH